MAKLLFSHPPLYYLCGLAGAEDAVTSVAKAWKDIVLIVEALVESCYVDIYIGVMLLNGGDSLG